MPLPGHFFDAQVLSIPDTLLWSTLVASSGLGAADVNVPRSLATPTGCIVPLLASQKK